VHWCLPSACTGLRNVDSSIDCRLINPESLPESWHQHSRATSSRRTSSAGPFKPTILNHHSSFLPLLGGKMWSWPTDPLYSHTTELSPIAKSSLWLAVTVGFAVLGFQFIRSEICCHLASTARTRYSWSVYILYRATWANISEGNTKDEILDIMLLDCQSRRMGSAPGSIV
jgi:hypothetical protein